MKKIVLSVVFLVLVSMSMFGLTDAEIEVARNFARYSINVPGTRDILFSSINTDISGFNSHHQRIINPEPNERINPPLLRTTRNGNFTRLSRLVIYGRYKDWLTEEQFQRFNQQPRSEGRGMNPSQNNQIIQEMSDIVLEEAFTGR